MGKLAWKHHGNISTMNKNKKEKTNHGKKLTMEKSRNDQSGASLFTSNYY